MHVGWMTLGEGLPLDPASNFADEMVNNERAYAYADHLGLGWLQDCLECDTASDVALSGVTYTDPVSDPAPWYTPTFPELAGFGGIVGVDVTGAEDSTVTATVRPALTGGGKIGPRYAGPRTMVLRGLAVADGECALQEGFNWFTRKVKRLQSPGCIGDRLTFFYCCPPMTCRDADPCPCDDLETPGGPCWANTYGELRDGPTECTPTWWPSTYAELRDGPPTDDEWCHWVYQYYEIKLGADAWSCASEECVVPYVWQFYECAVTEGPTVLDHRTMSTGALLEFEMTLVAGDPHPHRLRGHTVWPT